MSLRSRIFRRQKEDGDLTSKPRRVDKMDPPHLVQIRNPLEFRGGASVRVMKKASQHVQHP